MSGISLRTFPHFLIRSKLIITTRKQGKMTHKKESEEKPEEILPEWCRYNRCKSDANTTDAKVKHASHAISSNTSSIIIAGISGNKQKQETDHQEVTAAGQRRWQCIRGTIEVQLIDWLIISTRLHSFLLWSLQVKTVKANSRVFQNALNKNHSYNENECLSNHEIVPKIQK